MVIEQSDGYMMAYQNSPWIEAAWESEAAKDGKSVCRDVNDILDKYAVGMCICSEGMYDGNELVLGARKDIWEHIKNILVDNRRKERKETYMGKKMQSEIYKGLEEPVTSG